MAWLALLAVWPLDRLHPDSTRDLLMARDCWALDRCETTGPNTSVPGIAQGGLWMDLLAVFRALGATPAAIGGGLALAQALALLVAFARMRRTPGRADGVMLAVLLMGSAQAAHVVLWAPTAMMPVALLATFNGLDWLSKPTWGRTLLTGLLLGIAADLHAVAWLLALTVAAMAWQRTSRRHAVLLLAIALGYGLLVSPHAWVQMIFAQREHPQALGLGLAVPLFFAAMGRIRAWPPERQLAGVGLLAVAGISAVHQFELRYAVPWLGAFALAAPTLPWPRWLGHKLLLLLVLVVGMGPLSHGAPMTYRHAAVIAQTLQNQGIGWPDALTRLRGPQAAAYAEAAALYLPLAHGAPTDAIVQTHALDADAIAVDASTTRLEWRGARVCWPGPHARACAPVDVDPPPANPQLPFGSRAWPYVLPVPADAASVELTVPVRAGPANRLTLAPSRWDSSCAWRFPSGAPAVDVSAAAQDVRMQCHIADPRRSRELTRGLPPLQETALAPARLAPQRLAEPRLGDAPPWSRPFAAAALAALFSLLIVALGIARGLVGSPAVEDLSR